MFRFLSNQQGGQHLMIYSLAVFFADYFKIEREIFVSQN